MKLDNLLNKKVKVRQKDNFVKKGVLTGYDEMFIYLLFENGEKVAINKDAILEIKELKEGDTYGKN